MDSASPNNFRGKWSLILICRVTMSPVKTKFTTSLLKLPFFLSNGVIRLKKNVELENVIYLI